MLHFWQIDEGVAEQVTPVSHGGESIKVQIT
jgi:hypothetical protein